MHAIGVVQALIRRSGDAADAASRRRQVVANMARALREFQVSVREELGIGGMTKPQMLDPNDREGVPRGEVGSAAEVGEAVTGG
jgi:hypothetical protein